MSCKLIIYSFSSCFSDNNFEDTDYFIIATRSTISRVSLDGLRYEILVENLGNAIAIDYDFR